MVLAQPLTKSVLIVEDNDVERIGLATLLRQHGFAARELRPGEDIIERVRAEQPGVILLDMMLGGHGEDGWQVLAALRARPDVARVPVLIVTGLGIASAEWARSMGAAGLIRKPINSEELFAKLHHYLPTEA